MLDRITADKGVLGLLKAEEGDNIICEYVGLCSKMYALRLMSPQGEETTERKGKGVPRAVLLRNTTFEQYTRMAEAPYSSTATFRCMRSTNHEVHVRELQRKMLSCVNDKVYVVSANESRPLGHWRNSPADL